MFPAPYFASRYFPARYWPKNGAAAAEEAPSTAFVLHERGAVFACERRGITYERAVDWQVFSVELRGLAFEAPPRGTVFFVEEN